MKTRSYVSWRALAACEGRERVRAAHLDRLRRDAELPQIPAQDPHRARVALDEHGRFARPCESASIAERTGAREQVEHARPLDVAEHREHRLATRSEVGRVALPAGARRRLPPRLPAITRMHGP